MTIEEAREEMRGNGSPCADCKHCWITTWHDKGEKNGVSGICLIARGVSGNIAHCYNPEYLNDIVTACSHCEKETS